MTSPNDILFVKIDTNWADEMDITGCVMMKASQFQAFMDAAREHFETESEMSICCGTNEDLIYESFDDYASIFKTTVVTKDEAKLIEKLIPNVWLDRGPNRAGCGGWGSIPLWES